MPAAAPHPEPTPDAPLLAYGVEPRFRHWRLWVAWAAAAVLVLIGAVAVRRVVRAFQAQSAHLAAQARLSNQLLPPGTVLYTEDPARIAALRGQAGYRDARKSKSHRAEDVAVMPDAWERDGRRWLFEAVEPGPTEVRHFQVDDTFSYRRTSKGGVEWILLLGDGGPFAGRGGKRKAGVTQSVFSPVDWWPGARGSTGR